jgi:hypothetical protein
VGPALLPALAQRFSPAQLKLVTIYIEQRH